MVLGVPADKDWRGVIDTLAPLAESVWLTRASNNHLVFPEDAEALLLPTHRQQGGGRYNTASKRRWRREATARCHRTQPLIRDAR